MSSSVSAIRKRAPRAGAKSFTSYDDFEPAFTTARRSLAAVVGPNWHLVPGASVWARPRRPESGAQW
jgi:hypothetical protein